MALNPYESPRGRMRARARRRDVSPDDHGWAFAAAGAAAWSEASSPRFMFPRHRAMRPRPVSRPRSPLISSRGVAKGKAVTPSTCSRRPTSASPSSRRRRHLPVYLVWHASRVHAELRHDVDHRSGVSPTLAKGRGPASPTSSSPTLGVPLSRQPLLHRLDELLRPGSAADGLVNIEVTPGRVLRGDDPRWWRLVAQGTIKRHNGAWLISTQKATEDPRVYEEAGLRE